MKIYSVKSGKYYFSGNKLQPIMLMIGLPVIFIILSVIFGSWTLSGLALISFVIIYSLSSHEISSIPKRVYFSDSCLYRLTDNFDQVNKLYGFSEGFHHWNSARIGWRCIDNENIELLAYAYVNGKRTISPMIKIKPQKWVVCCIQKKSGKYVFKAIQPQGECITVSIDIDTKWSKYSFFKLFIYRLYPYFGGKISAPNDMELSLDKKLS